MEITYSSIAMASAIIVIVSWAFLKGLSWLWLRPKRLEKLLRQQGFNGNSYNFLRGDLTEIGRMTEEAKSRPMGLSNDIIPRVRPQLPHFINKYGKNYFEWHGPVPIVNIQEPELVKEVLTKNFKFEKPKMNPLVELLATGVVAYEAEKWAKHRKIINPAFHTEKLKGMLPAIYLSCDEMVSKWSAMISAKGSCELDVCPDLEILTSDVISRTAFGSNYEEGRKIFELQREQVALVVETVRTIYIPGWRFLPTKRNKRMKEIYMQVQDALMGIIRRRLRVMDTDKAKDNSDLLDILLKSNLEEIKQHGNNKEAGMSIKEVVEECRLFYFAGQETTSAVLMWAMVLLSWHRNWQQKAREEVMQMFGREAPTADGLNYLKVVSSILYEVMRLYPPVVSVSRTIREETKLARTLLPAGVLLSLPVILIHHDHETWGDDANEFNPERFFEGISKATKNQLTYCPFGWGPRICIGQNFAMLEAKLALVMILQRFTFELSPSYTHAPYTSMLLKPQHGAHLILHKL